MAAVILIIAVVLVGYIVGGWLLLAITQPKRLRLAEVGRAILEHPASDEKLRSFVASLLDDAYSAKFMIFMALIIPFAGVVLLFTGIDRKPVSCHLEVQRLFDELVDLHILATSAANPIFAAVVAVEMAVLTLVLFPFGLESRGRIVQVAALKRVELGSRLSFA